jgi:hypothetical protein
MEQEVILASLRGNICFPQWIHAGNLVLASLHMLKTYFLVVARCQDCPTSFLSPGNQLNIEQIQKIDSRKFSKNYSTKRRNGRFAGEEFA